MKYTQFLEHVQRNGWTVPQLRCDVRPTNELLQFIDVVGDDYEAFVRRYSRPGDFHAPDVQQRLLTNGTREDVIAWLCWNDPNGVYTDADSERELGSVLTIESAREIMKQQIER